MYFEPIRKTYHRFPSTNGNNDFESKYYFPEKPHASGEDTRFEAAVTNHVPNRETFHDV